MPAIIGKGVTLQGYLAEAFVFTWNISGTNGVSPGLGCPMTQDSTANATMKVAGDGNSIFGMLRSYENRIQEGIVVGAIAHKGNFTFPYTGTAPTLGASVVGSATPGSVKAASAVAGNVVVEVDTTAQTVTVMLG